MKNYSSFKGLERGDLIIQQEEDTPHRFYVQEVALLDMGRFQTLTEAENHKNFLEESKY